MLSGAHSASLIDYRLTLSKVSTPINCTSAGPVCQSCKNVVVCIHNSDNSWTHSSVETCPSGEKCIRGSCTSASDPVCDGVADLDFPCNAEGIFPDPFYCNKYVMCVNVGKKLQAYLTTCEEGLSYNIATGMCDTKLENSVCNGGDYPIPLCEKPGDTGPLRNKTAEYYMCQEYSRKIKYLYPFIDICPHAGQYDNFNCTTA